MINKKRKKLYIALAIMWVIILAINFRDYYTSNQIVDYVNSFSSSDHCMVTMANGEVIKVDGQYWQDIVAEDRYFNLIEKGKNIFKDQDLDLLMTLELYKGDQKLSTIEIHQILSSDDKIKKLDDLANENKEFRVHHYYDQVGDMKLLTIGNGFYLTGMDDFLNALFEEIAVFMD